MLNLFESWWCS